MGDYQLFNGDQRKQQQDSSNTVYGISNSSIGHILNRNNMEWWTGLIKISSLFLFPLWIVAWVTNLDNTKSTILFITALIMGGVRFYFFAKRQSQLLEKGRQESRMRELDLKEREHKTKEEELKLFEEELSLRITGLSVKQRKDRDKGKDY